MLLNRFFRVFYLQRTRKYVPLPRVFHSIRFKVNKRLEFSGTPFFMPVRHLQNPFLKTLRRSFLNASAFQTKRLCVLIQTQVRFTQNVRAFKLKRKGVF